MPTIDDVRAFALSFPETIEKIDGHRGEPTWRTPAGPFVWVRRAAGSDLEKLAKLDLEWPSGPVVGVRTDGLETKEALLGSFPDAFFTIAHFDGYPAVLVRLDAIPDDLLRETITDAWLARAPQRLVKEWLAQHPSP